MTTDTLALLQGSVARKETPARVSILPSQIKLSSDVNPHVFMGVVIIITNTTIVTL